jgi:hypothetical protein
MNWTFVVFWLGVVTLAFGSILFVAEIDYGIAMTLTGLIAMVAAFFMED